MTFFGPDIRNGLPIGLGSVAGFGRRAFTPSVLFAAGEQGFWYDPSDLSSMFQDSAGTTPVTAVEQAVGLILDKSKGLVLGPELVTNGDFSSATGWTVGAGWAITGGVAEATSASSNLLQTNVAPSPQGKTYRVQLTIVTRSAGSIVPQISGAIVTLSAPGTYVFYLTPTGTDATLYIPASGFTGTIDNVSVRQIFGNHAIQPGATNRPILRSRYNQLLYSEDFSNAIWVTGTGGTGVSAVKTPNFGIAPDGTQTACRVQLDKGAGTTDGDFARMFQSSTVTSSVRRIWIKTNDASTKTFRLEAAGSNITVTGTWTQISDAASASSLQVLLQGTTSTTADFLVWHPELVRSSDTYLPYQRIAASTDYDTVGFPVYLAFDGSDDSLYTGGNVDFSATDKITLWAGVTKLSDANVGSVVCYGANYTNAPGFEILAPETAGQPRYGIGASSTVAGAQVGYNASFAAPTTNVVTGTFDVSSAPAGARLQMRVDSAAQSLTLSGAGIQAGNFGSARITIGARNLGVSERLNGRLYQAICRGAETSAALIQQADRWVAGKQGRAL